MSEPQVPQKPGDQELTEQELDKMAGGAVAPLTAILLAPASYAIDLGYIASTRSEVQNSGERAPLAGLDDLRGSR